MRDFTSCRWRGIVRIAILAMGTRGDVQPYVALGLGLQRAGHDVYIASLDLFRDFVEDVGLGFVSAGPVPKKLGQFTFMMK